MNSVKRGNNVVIREGCYLGENVILGDNVFLDYNCIIRDNVTIEEGTTIGANCIIGEYTGEWYKKHQSTAQETVIGGNSIVRSGSIIYQDVISGEHFQTGHQVTIREGSRFGAHCSVGTLTDIQGHCTIGNYVRCHSNVHIGMRSVLDDYVWIYPYVVLTNDPTPPSTLEVGVHVHSFAVIATGSVILPGLEIETDTLVAAGATVTKDVKKGTIVGGNPAKVISTIDRVKNHATGERAYPWRYHFDRGMPWEGMGFEAWEKANRD